MSRDIAGFLVIETCDGYEQTLALSEGNSLPKGGLLVRGDKNTPRAMFASRKDARAAIARTEHYRLAFGHNRPGKRLCHVVPVRALAAIGDANEH